MCSLKIGIVGPCAAGKSTLIAGLASRGVSARHIAQEHSFVPDMWKRLVNPDVLIYLDVSYRISTARKKMNWTEDEFHQQVLRLEHAKDSADLYISTDALTPEEVLSRSWDFLTHVQKTA